MATARAAASAATCAAALLPITPVRGIPPRDRLFFGLVATAPPRFFGLVATAPPLLPLLLLARPGVLLVRPELDFLALPALVLPGLQEEAGLCSVATHASSGS